MEKFGPDCPSMMPAYPSQSDLHGKQHKGFTKREEYAKAAMQTLLAHYSPGVLELPSGSLRIAEMARLAFRVADEMVKESQQS